MAKTQDLKRRIRSIRNTMQLTRAMKMVSAAKLRRSQDRMMAARPYALQTLKVLKSVASRANRDANPLLQEHGDHQVEVVVLTADKGLCGSFNAHIIRRAETLIQSLGDREVTVCAIGRKARDYFTKRNYRVDRSWTDVFRDVQFPLAAEISDHIIELYTKKDLDQVYLVYNEFKSAIQARPIVERLLPVETLDLEPGTVPEDYIYEPGSQQLFDELLPHYVGQQLFHALLESVAAEHAARMTAMDAATNNASDLIESLTLTMNRVRQAAITTEIIEVVSGAQALS